MLRGLRTAIQYFTLGLALGLLLAPRKGDETRAMLIDQIRSYAQDAFQGAQGAMSDDGHHPDDASRGAYRVDRDYNDSTTSGVQ
jgi:gas vesicle protein